MLRTESTGRHQNTFARMASDMVVVFPIAFPAIEGTVRGRREHVIAVREYNMNLGNKNLKPAPIQKRIDATVRRFGLTIVVVVARRVAKPVEAVTVLGGGIRAGAPGRHERPVTIDDFVKLPPIPLAWVLRFARPTLALGVVVPVDN